jgi:hypothetical protein
MAQTIGSAGAAQGKGIVERTASTPWTDLGLTLPIFVVYHLGVVWLPVRNSADLVTEQLVALANHSLPAYAGLTLGIAFVYVGILLVAGRKQGLDFSRFGWIFCETVVYAIAMRYLAAYAVGQIPLASVPKGVGPSLIMSLGAGFYEEIAFRVLLFGLGAKALIFLADIAMPLKRLMFQLIWALVCAAIFSGWHYVGHFADAFDLRSFTFRMVCGLVFTLIYVFRGFAPAVWTHTLYDLWVLVL